MNKKNDNFGIIRSYVLRAGRMSPSQRKAYETYSHLYCIPFRNSPLDFTELFPGRKNVVAEIGFGMGNATAEIASYNPDTGYLGFEVHTPGVGKLLNLIRERNLTNIRIIEHDAVEAWRAMIPDNSLSGIHIFFPDPWPKKRHHKRRLLKENFLSDLVRTIRQGGYIHAATDWEDYAFEILSLFENNPALRNTAAGFSVRPEWRPLTAFESKGTEAGRGIFEIIFKKI